MSNWFDKEYKTEYVSALYSLYEGSDDSVLNELLSQLCPLVRKCFKLEFRSTGHCDQGYLEAEALNKVYHVVESKSIPNHHPQVFSRFLSTVIIRTFRDVTKTLSPQVFELWSIPQSYPAAQLPSHFDVEASIYKEQIAVQIRKAVQNKIRFFGKDNDACCFILDCELGYKSVDAGTARRKYEISSHKCKYFIKYVTILLRATLWEFGEREHKNGPLSSNWASGGSVLRTSSELR